MADGAQTNPSIDRVEHIDENISAKRAGVYAHDGANWQRLQVDGSGNLKTVSTGGAGGGPATIADGADVAEGATTDAVVAAGAAGTVSAKLRRLTTDLDTVKTNTTSIATAAKQDTGNTSLSSIDTKTPALGQQLAAASSPVVLPAAQITTLTPPTSVGVNNFPATQAVSIASMPSTPVTGPLTDTQLRASAVPVSLATAPTTAVTGPLTDTQLRASAVPVNATLTAETTKVIGTVNVAAAQSIGVTQTTGTNLHTVVDSGTITTVGAVTAITNALPAGTNNIGGINNAQVNGVTTATGSGINGTGVQRVTIATDDTLLTGGTQQTKITDGTNIALVANTGDADIARLGLVVDNRNKVWNGSSYDRMRGMSVATTTGDTGAKVATGNGATQTNVGNKGLFLVIALGTVTGTTPTAVFKLQGSADGGTTFVDIPGATTASLTATGNWGISLFPGQAVTAGTTTTGTQATASGVLPRTWRVVWTIGGTTPSFTITSITYNYIPH